MKSQLLDEVIACLPTGKTHYRYFQGAYASRILSMLMPEKAELHTIKQTRFKRFLEHKTIKPIVALSGSERDWYQTSRGGENLVLQLNLPVQHQRQFTRWVDPFGGSSLNGTWSSHPVQTEIEKPSFRETHR